MLEVRAPAEADITQPVQPPVADLTTLAAALLQLSSVLATLTDAQYSQSPVGMVEGSVGGHVRHCLDHVHALMAGSRRGEIDYDHRVRGTSIERDRTSALDALRLARLELLRACVEPNQRVTVRVLLSPNEPATQLGSTFGRESAYVLSHTIHHHALIGAMVRTLGGWLPDRFGYAPSTIAHQREALTCAR